MLLASLSLLLLVPGCSAPAHSSCAELTVPAEADMCHYHEALAATTPAGAASALRRVRDPVVLSAGVFEWLRAHPQAERREALELCKVLSSTEARTCDRRVASEHLHR